MRRRKKICKIKRRKTIRNADMNRKGTIQIGSTNIIENIVKILLREGFIDNVRKHRERNKYFLEARLEGIGGEILCYIW
ncbi:hypothetical protein ES332_A09G284700v1 [Gossypium tomentosum]|uniref:30S ribosomal protein S8, chloroplastic n=1 Tax=Gossypium tomentosum TaxID=34277 RepID=A0A5D2PCJ4_GOSTO|nr:hypothetical protein ES332_A09G284700v1 [Gossypium tomentosum]